LQDFNGVKARRLSAHRVHAGGFDCDVLPVPEKPPEKSFGHGASTDVARADKEDVFHDRTAAAIAQPT